MSTSGQCDASIMNEKLRKTASYLNEELVLTRKYNIMELMKIFSKKYKYKSLIKYLLVLNIRNNIIAKMV